MRLRGKTLDDFLLSSMLAKPHYDHAKAPLTHQTFRSTCEPDFLLQDCVPCVPSRRICRMNEIARMPTREGVLRAARKLAEILPATTRSDEPTHEHQSLMRTSYAVLRLK